MFVCLWVEEELRFGLGELNDISFPLTSGVETIAIVNVP